MNKTFKKNLLSAATIAALTTTGMSVQAADWTIIQNFNGATSPVLDQGNTTLVTDSTQAINSIALNLTTPDDLLNGSSQDVSLNGSASVVLTQGGSANVRATQALNNIVADNVGTGLVSAVLQTISTSPTLTTLSQTSVGGSDNVQAINNVDAQNSILGLSQTYVPGTTLNLNQVDTTSARDQQAINRAELTADGDVTGILQTATGASGATTFEQTGTAVGLVQAGNLIDIGTGNSITGATNVDQQVFTGGVTTILNQTSNTARQALNAIVYLTSDAASNTEQELTLSGATTTFTQNDTTSSAQAGNYVGTKGT
ncbi:MAG: hypothetical protein A6F71_02805 [Cycloclasticus sp. symbiont of Poecilosclerida sp. M]|nr:MAG: hypothetical protein A6F71_02805 [Cycloclasticus sp. symbiont of Poecilosclerida sp. M]